MIFIAGVSITCFLCLVLITKRAKSEGDKILIAWLGVISLHLTCYSILFTQSHLQFPYLLGVEIPLPLLHGPLLYLYTASFTIHPVSFSKRALHFIPFLLAVLLVAPFYSLSAEAKLEVYHHEGAAYALQMSIIFAASVISGLIYTSLSLYALHQHKKHIKNTYSSIEKINLRWLFNLIIGLSCIWVIVLLAEDIYIFTAVVLYVIFIGYFGIKQVGIFTNTLPAKEAPSAANADAAKYEKSMLADAQLEKIYKDLTELMQVKKRFQTTELTLAMVADELNVHPNTLSQVINRMTMQNFFDYINLLRVQEFQARVALPENHKYTLLALAYDCGFNSKTSFNRNFKKITGKSPSEYLKALNVVLK